MRIVEVFPEALGTDPVPTERIAFERLRARPLAADVVCVVAPWAWLWNQKKIDRLPTMDAGGGFTVCQHTDVERFFPMFRRCGIATVFSPHYRKRFSFRGPKLLPFPHFPIHTAAPAKKDLLYSFVGSDSSPRHPVRRKIFSANHPATAFVRERAEWHWAKQNGWSKTETDPEAERQEYVSVLSRSRFSLCPRGYGISTIRFWESLVAGAIPVVLADGFVAPAGVDWSQCTITVRERDAHRVAEIVSAVPLAREEALRAAALAAAKHFHGDGFVQPIRDHFGER